MGDYYSRKLTDVKGKFNAIPKTGFYEKIGGLPYYSNIAVDHVQGYILYHHGSGAKHHAFTHSISGGDGRVIIRTSSGTQTEIRIKDWYHPGGIQAVGQFLFVPCEGKSSARVFVYDLLNPKSLPIKTFDFGHKAGALGITDFIMNEIPHYLLVIGDNGSYYAYTSPLPQDGNMVKVSFSSIGRFDLKNISGHNVKKDKTIHCQGFGLITDTNNTLYLLALESRGSGATYADWAFLINLSVRNNKIGFSIINSRHMVNKGGVSGVAGSHYRWGAGISISKDNGLHLLATSRNIIAGTFLNTTYWK